MRKEEEKTQQFEKDCEIENQDYKLVSLKMLFLDFLFLFASFMFILSLNGKLVRFGKASLSALKIARMNAEFVNRFLMIRPTKIWDFLFVVLINLNLFCWLNFEDIEFSFQFSKLSHNFMECSNDDANSRDNFYAFRCFDLFSFSHLDMKHFLGM